MTRDTVTLRGLVFYGYHGVLPEENTLGQRFIVDIDISFDLREAGRTDDISKTVNYVDVHADVRAIVEGPAHKLIESVAERIATHILEAHGAESVSVRVQKPDVPIPAALESVGVSIVRSRDGSDSTVDRDRRKNDRRLPRA